MESHERGPEGERGRAREGRAGGRGGAVALCAARVTEIGFPQPPIAKLTSPWRWGFAGTLADHSAMPPRAAAAQTGKAGLHYETYHATVVLENGCRYCGTMKGNCLRDVEELWI